MIGKRVVRGPRSPLAWLRLAFLVGAVALLGAAGVARFAPAAPPPAPQPANPLAQGLDLLRRDHYTAAVTALTAATLADPPNLAARLALGQADVRRALYAEADGVLAQVRRELMYDPALAPPTCDADLRTHVAPPPPALLAVNDLTARRRGLLDALLWDGRALAAQGQNAAADALWRCGLALAGAHNEGVAGGRLAAALGDAALNRGDYAAALALDEPALAATDTGKALPPDERQTLLFNVGLLRLHAGQRDAGAALWRLAHGIEVAPQPLDDSDYRPLAARLDALRDRVTPALAALDAAGQTPDMGYIYTLVAAWPMAVEALQRTPAGDDAAYLAYATCHTGPSLCLSDDAPNADAFTIVPNEAQAETALRAAIAQDSTNRLCREYLGQLLVARATRRAVSAQESGGVLPSDAAAWLDEATGLFTTLARDVPRNPLPQLDLARAAAARRDYTAAADILHAATGLDPAPGVNVWAEYAAFYVAGNAPTDCDKAKDAADNALTVAPGDVRSWNIAGWTAYVCARYDDARQALTHALTLRPNSAELRYRLALVLDRLHDPAAERSLTLADDIAPAADYRHALPVNYGK